MIDLELEQTILGGMIMHQECLPSAMARLKKEYFVDSLHRALFEYVTKMYTDGKQVDIVTVAQECKGLLKDRGATWLCIKETLTSVATYDYLIDKLEKLYKLRNLNALAQRIAEQANEQEDPEKILADIEQSIYSAVDNSQSSIISPKEHAFKMLETLESRITNKSNGGIKTRYAELNRALNGGFEPGQLIILAAQTGKGKTAFAMNLMRDIAVIQKIPALYINTEMSDEQMNVRWMTILSGIKYYEIATGKIDNFTQGQIMLTMEQMHNSGFYSVTEPSLTLNKLVTISRRFAAQKKCRVIVVDYIGRMDTLDPKLQEWQVLKTAAKRLKTLAQDLGLTVIMLAQVNENEKLEGAKAMKNECDLYGYLRPLYDDEIGQMTMFNYCLSIEKNRSGPTKKIPLKFRGETLIFGGEGDEQLA